MTTQLTEKYRPDSWDGLIGNKDTIKAIRSVLAKPGRPHTYLLTGPKGCGKTTIARIMATAIGATGRDIHELNNANYRGVDAARTMMSEAAMRPWNSKASVWILDECHQITGDAQNALLKDLEKPPKHVYYILCTTDPDKLKDTVISRCARYQVTTLSAEEIFKHLDFICTQEGRTEHPTAEVLNHITTRCMGSMRQAIMMLDQVIDIEDEQQAMAAVVEATGDEYQTIQLCRALLQGRDWDYLKHILSKMSIDQAESIRHAILGYMGTVLLDKPNDNVARLVQPFLGSFIYSGKTGLILACWQAAKSNPAPRGNMVQGR